MLWFRHCGERGARLGGLSVKSCGLGGGRGDVVLFPLLYLSGACLCMHLRLLCITRVLCSSCAFTVFPHMDRWIVGGAAPIDVARDHDSEERERRPRKMTENLVRGNNYEMTDRFRIPI